MSILEMLGFNRGTSPKGATAAETETVRKIVESLNHMEPDRARFIAAFAYILSRVAGADLDISREETGEMERIVEEWGGLDTAQAVLVVQIAKSQNLLFGGTENFLVTREFNEIASREDKIGLLHCLFAVSAADDSISTVEGSVIRQIADEIKLDQRDYANVRSAYREHLEVLKESRPSNTEPE